MRHLQSVKVDKEISKSISIVAALTDRSKQEIIDTALREYLAPYLSQIKRLRFGSGKIE